MAVYLDDANVPWRGMRWCHLFADSLPELEQFAREVGLNPEWLQHPDGTKGLPHYDVTGRMKEKAVTLGAVLITPGDGTYRRLRRALAQGEYQLSES